MRVGDQTRAAGEPTAQIRKTSSLSLSLSLSHPIRRLLPLHPPIPFLLSPDSNPFFIQISPNSRPPQPHISLFPSQKSNLYVYKGKMAENPGSPASPESPGGGGDHSPRGGGSSNVREQDRFLPIANIGRIMKKALPANGKIAKDAKETVQECVSEFISFVTSEASDKCQREKRKTINGDDLLWAMGTLGFEDYIEPLKVYLQKFREMEGDSRGPTKNADGSYRKDTIGAGSDQIGHQSSFSQDVSYMQPQGQHLVLPMQGTE